MTSTIKDSLGERMLKKTHQVVFPILESGERYIAFCFFSHHRGILHPTAYSELKSCRNGCPFIKKYPLPYRFGIDESEFQNTLDRLRNFPPKTPTRAFQPYTDEESGRKFLWVLDRGCRVYIPRRFKLESIQRLEEDHSRLYL